MNEHEREPQAPDERRIAQLRALLARLEADGAADDPPARAVKSLLEDAEQSRKGTPRARADDRS
jgi:hypothetical protein